MATAPNEIRAEIEATRAELADDVDRLADRTSPKRIAARRWDGVKSTFRRASGRVMGASQDAGSSVKGTVSGATDRVQDAAHGVADAAREAPARVADRTRGNPLAVGLIAFGAGLLAASLLPETEAERRAGEQLAERADKVVEPLKETGRDLGESLKESTRDAADEVKETAREAVETTKDRAAESGQDAVRQTTEAVKR
jgi:gas vesicle protein